MPVLVDISSRSSITGAINGTPLSPRCTSEYPNVLVHLRLESGSFNEGINLHRPKEMANAFAHTASWDFLAESEGWRKCPQFALLSTQLSTSTMMAKQ